MQCRCLEPVARNDSRVLILGSLPGSISLEQGEYYAHSRNAFWDILGKLLGFTRNLGYQERLNLLLEHRIALWDVCAAAHRIGSLDTAIRKVVPNDFATFFQSHPAIELVCFNGVKAEALYNREVRAKMALVLEGVRYCRLPSTSPAYASLSFDKKARAWAAIRLLR